MTDLKPRKVRGSLSVALESLKFILECLNIFGSAGHNRCLVAVEFRISNHANIFRYMQISELDLVLSYFMIQIDHHVKKGAFLAS